MLPVPAGGAPPVLAGPRDPEGETAIGKCAVNVLYRIATSPQHGQRRRRRQASQHDRMRNSAAIRLSAGWQAGFAGALPHPQRCAGSPPARRGVQPRQGAQALSPPAASLATPAPALTAPRALAPGAAVLLPAR